MRLSGRLTMVIAGLLSRWSLRGGGNEGQLAAPAGEQAGLVDAEDGDGVAVAAVDGQEAALFGVAVFDGDVVVGVGDAGELDAGAVLVGPEVRGFRRGGGGAVRAGEQGGHR